MSGAKKLLTSYKFFLTLLLLSLSACIPQDKADITALLEARNQAINSQNIAAYGQVIMQNYQDHGRTREDTLKQMQQLFERFERIDMQSSNRHIHLIDATHAECEQSYTLKVFADGQWRHIVQREQLQLSRSDKQWQIQAGL
ncbi:MAG: hypothetical protein R8K49_03410 [Mariprofundaceae bacterium]